MTFLPIVERELRVRARQRATYWTRFAAVLLGLLIGLPQLALSRAFSGPAQTGRGMFDALLVVAFIWCCGACLATADVISSERRDGTLGLLFLTRVKCRDVILGKLSSAGLASACALVAFLPLLMIPLLAGGVTWGEAARKALGLMNMLFFALTVGLCASAGGRERFRSARDAIGILLVLLAALTIIGLVSHGVIETWYDLGLLSPLMTLIDAGDSVYKASPARYWVSLALVQALGWFFVYGASLRLRRCDFEAGDVESSRTPPLADSGLPSTPLATPEQSSTPVTRERRFGQGDDPVEWLVRRQRGLKAMIWIAALLHIVTYVSPFFSGFYPPGTSLPGAFSWPLSVAVSASQAALLAWAASRFLVEARSSGELELLRTTPLGAQSIVSAQWSALRKVLYRPVVFMVVIYLLPYALALATLRGSYLAHSFESWLVYALISVPLRGTVMVLGVVALCWLALWYGLSARSQLSAILWTIGWVKGLPFLAGLAFSMLINLSISYLPFGRGALPIYILNGLLELGILLYLLWLIRLAKRNLSRALACGNVPTLKARQFLKAVRRARHWTLPA